MKKLFYFLIAIPLLFTGCKDDETPEACSAFLDCSSEVLWKMDEEEAVSKFKTISKEQQQAGEPEEVFVQFDDDMVKPVKVWGKERNMTCYYNVWEDNGYMPIFEIIDNGKDILKIKVTFENETNYEMWTFEVNEENDSKIDLKIEYFENGETDIEYISFSRTSINSDDMDICMPQG